MWRVADEELWGRTPLDRLVKFGTERECRLVAQVACTFVAAGTRADTAASTNGGDAVMPWLASASRILTELESMPEAWPFLRPVTEQEAPGYFQEITHPMDLSTVRSKLDSRQYQNARAWLADLRLMLANALQYNRPKDVVYNLALDVGRALEGKVDVDEHLQADMARTQELHDAEQAQPNVRVAAGWHVPPPINHTQVRLKKMQRRAARTATTASSSSSTTRPLPSQGAQRVPTKPMSQKMGGGGHTPTHPHTPHSVPARESLKEREEKIWRKECARALMRLWKHKESWPFLEPVDPVALQIPTYFDIIKQPMDLGTVKTKLNNGTYTKAEEFAYDVRLVFENAMTFNPRDHWVYAMAVTLQNLFENTWIECTMRLERKRMDLQRLV